MCFRSIGSLAADVIEGLRIDGNGELRTERTRSPPGLTSEEESLAGMRCDEEPGQAPRRGWCVKTPRTTRSDLSTTPRCGPTRPQGGNYAAGVGPHLRVVDTHPSEPQLSGWIGFGSRLWMLVSFEASGPVATGYVSLGVERDVPAVPAEAVIAWSVAARTDRAASVAALPRPMLLVEVHLCRFPYGGDVRQSSEAYEMAVGWRDCFAHFTEGHPVDTQGFRSGRFVSTFPHVPSAPSTSASSALTSMAAVDANNRPAIMRAARRRCGQVRDIGLEQTVPLQLTALRAQPETRTAQAERIDKFAAGLLDILNDPERGMGGVKSSTDFADKSRGSNSPWRVSHGAVALTRRARPNEVKALGRKRQSIGLVELVAAVSWLWFDIDASDVEAGELQAAGGSPGAGKNIERAQLAHGLRPST